MNPGGSNDSQKFVSNQGLNLEDSFIAPPSIREKRLHHMTPDEHVGVNTKQPGLSDLIAMNKSSFQSRLKRRLPNDVNIDLRSLALQQFNAKRLGALPGAPDDDGNLILLKHGIP